MILIQVIITLILFDYVGHYIPTPVVHWHEKLFFMIQIAIIWSFLFYKFRLGVIFRATSFSSMIRGYLVTLSIAGVLLFFELRLMLILGHVSYSASYIFTFCLVNFVVLTTFKLIFYQIMKNVRKAGRNSRNVLIIADSSAITFISTFIKTSDWGYNVKHIMTPDLLFPNLKIHTIYFENDDEVIEQISMTGIDDVFYCLPITNKMCNAEKIIEEAEEIGVSVHIMQEEFYNFHSNNDFFENTFENTFETHESTSIEYFGLKIKDIFDILFSAIVLVITIPLMLIITILIYLEDRGPIFFQQERIGLHGRRFICYKFRSMVIDAEQQLENLKDKNESDGPTFKIGNDPRITRIGRILRKTSLDEFPQFYIINRGEMSIVGPRPPLLKEVMQYQKYQLRRLSMKPGITCIRQVSERNAIKI